ncbi:hypothetical protein FB45DRAFT_757790 [Roridomyces roridus]|uniref:Uncharacterized protein n=1 Tax=Roridomyces roridus TaxID=1738132 RepID=A0AAD7FF91_9AGAR|nr:hypothetical protein FB45DRAFT_757790 [Roridomyces roridus]
MLWSFYKRNWPTPLPAGIRLPPIPCTPLDRLPSSSNDILTAGLIANARLDARKLENTLVTLIEEKFPRAGARLALRNGLYEFHVPETFGKDTPAVRFTVEDHAEGYRSNVSRPQLPMDVPGLSASAPTILKAPDLSTYFRRGVPRTLAEWIQTKGPLLLVHLSVFDDLTFIGVTFPHIGFDAVGIGIVLRAWTDLLNGSNLDDIAGMEWNAEPLEEFMPHHALTTTELSEGSDRVGVFGKMWFIARHLWSELWDPALVPTIVRVPKVFLAELKGQIMGELQKEGSDEWVSSSDVLTAWWYKETLRHRINDRTAVYHYMVANLRTRPIWSYGSEMGSVECIQRYIGNMVLPLPIPPLPASTFHDQSLTALALHFRRALNHYNTEPAEIRARVRWSCANPTKLPFPCPGDADYRFTTNWRIAGFGSLDFSGAQVQVANSCASEGRQAKKASVKFLHLMLNLIPPRYGICILMEDQEFVWLSKMSGKKELEDLRRRGNVLFA